MKNNNNINNNGIESLGLKQGGNETLQAFAQRVDQAIDTNSGNNNNDGGGGGYNNNADAAKVRTFMSGLDPTLVSLFPPGMQWSQITGQVELVAQSPDMAAIMGSSVFSCSNRNLVGFLAHAIVQDIPLRPTSGGGDEDPSGGY